MGKKTITQVILIIFLIVLTYFVFKKYYIKNDTVSESNKKDQTISKNESQKSDKNIIKDISYTANNSRGDIYLLLADYGEVYLDNPELMFLTKVNGKITLQDGMKVTIGFMNGGEGRKKIRISFKFRSWQPIRRCQ